MRAALLRSVLVLAVVGAVIGVLVALGVHWWDRHDAPTYSGAPRRYVDYLPRSSSTDWWGLLWPAATAGLALGVVVAFAIALTGRRLTVVRAR